MPDHKVFNVLFLCTGNSSRSIIAEAVLNAIGNGRFQGYSAGSHPGESVHPLAIEQIDRLGFPVTGLRSKSWDEFAAAGVPHMDFVITVCDRAAGEACPRWPGHPITAHWSFEDPRPSSALMRRTGNCLPGCVARSRTLGYLFDAASREAVTAGDPAGNGVDCRAKSERREPFTLIEDDAQGVQRPFPLHW